MFRKLMGVVAFCVLLVAACGGGGDTLEDTSWQVEMLRGADGSMAAPLADTVLTADFTADEIAGEAGCNSYFGTYTTDGDSFSTGPLGSTQRFCDPQAVMDQEVAYLAALSEADRWNRDGDQLELFQGDETVVQFASADS